jgi:hypothetical protein
MKKMILLSGMILLLCVGCSSSKFNDKELALRHDGIVDACYTVLEYNPQDKTERIIIYLEQKERAGQITIREKELIIKCINRTENSTRWSK